MVEGQPWAHIDIAGVMESHGEVPYLSKGMSGMYFHSHSAELPVNLIPMLDMCTHYMAIIVKII